MKDTVRCALLIDGGQTPEEHTFAAVPGAGDIVMAMVNGHTDSFRVVRVIHWATGASEDDPASSIALEVTRKLFP